MQDNAHSANDRRPSARALLFDANGEDRPVEDPHSLDLAGLTDKELAWIDIVSDGQEATEALMRELGVVEVARRGVVAFSRGAVAA